MKHHKALRLMTAILVGGGTLFAPGCDLLRRSLREAAMALAAGSASGYFDLSDFSNLLNNLLTGGFTGGWGGFNGGGGLNGSPFN